MTTNQTSELMSSIYEDLRRGVSSWEVWKEINNQLSWNPVGHFEFFEPVSEGDREQWDLLGAIDYVEARGIPVERIGLLGFSLGAGVAILVAAQEPRIPAIVSMDYVSDIRLIHTNA